MVSQIYSATLQGIHAQAVMVEVDSSLGLPGYSIVGLPDSSVREARERVVSALRSAGFQAVNRRITVNLSPADLRKEGSQFDLALAIGMMLATEQLRWIPATPVLCVGELSLDGSLRPIRGMLSFAMLAHQMGWQLMIPKLNIEEVSCLPGLSVLAADSLQECVERLCDGNEFLQIPPQSDGHPIKSEGPDFAQLQGLHGVRRALEIAAAGFHHFLMCGSPGSGKTMAAQCVPSILPPLENEESMECTMIHSCAGIMPHGSKRLKQRPFRTPHHSASLTSLVGGGSNPRPGEISLAHNGLLFLDEFPEFSRSAIEGLRQPMESGSVTVSRIRETVRWPASFLLGAAMNPCPCGYAWDPHKTCTCSPNEIAQYRKKISGPIMDRIDLQIQVPSIPLRVWESDHGESSAIIAERVRKAQQIQRNRNIRNPGDSPWNSRLPTDKIREFCRLDSKGEFLLDQATAKLRLSARGVLRVLKVSRTIADLEGRESILEKDISEAVQYRIE